jgi:CubicO group peptidase (beta-lactamase class C family)
MMHIHKIKLQLEVFLQLLLKGTEYNYIGGDIMKKYLKISMLYILMIIFLSGCLGSKTESVTGQPSAKDTAVTKLEGLLDMYSKDLNFGGTVLIVDNGETLIKKGYGTADYDKNIKNDSDTVFRLGSVTKQFTAMCILMLEERGLLKTTDSLDKYIPDYPNGNKITIHNLLTQTSGLAEYINAANILTADHYFSPMDIISSVKYSPLGFEPSSKYQYCNTNYILLGYIVEKVSGKKYEDFLKDNILTPLNMKNTDYDHNETSPDKAVGYVYGDGNLKEAAYIDMSFAYSAGALQSTVGDLYKWDQALYTEKLIKKESLAKMFKPNIDNYAYGWFMRSPEIMWHGGNINGFSTIIYRDTRVKRVIIILANRDQYNVGNMVNDILAVMDFN